MSELTKQERIIAYKAAMLVMSKLPTESQVRRAAGPNVVVDGAMMDRVIRRAQHILENLEDDAKDLWDES